MGSQRHVKNFSSCFVGPKSMRIPSILWQLSYMKFSFVKYHSPLDISLWQCSLYTCSNCLRAWVMRIGEALSFLEFWMEKERQHRCCHQCELWCFFIFLVAPHLYVIPKHAIRELKGPWQQLPLLEGEHLEWTKLTSTYLPLGFHMIGWKHLVHLDTPLWLGES